MSRIIKQDTNGTKPLLSTGEFGYDNYPAGGDAGRVYVGTGADNVALSKKSELDSHKSDVSNPHSVTKSQVGLGNVDNTSDANKPVSTATQSALNLKANLASPTFTGTVSGITKSMVGLSNVDNTADAVKSVASAGKWTTARTITLNGDLSGSVSIDGSANVTLSATVNANSVALGTDTTGNYAAGVTAGTGIAVTGTAGEGWSPTVSLGTVGTAGTYRSVTTDAYGRITAGTNPTTVAGYGLTDVYTKTESDLIRVQLSDTAPTSPVNGMKWFNTAQGVEYIRYGSAWVESGSRSVVGTGLTANNYGLTWDQTNDTYTRTGGSNYTEVQSKMRRCVVGLDGEVKYYLHPTNSTLKADGTAAVLDGTDGNVMVEVPKTYYKYEYDTTSGVKHKWSIGLVQTEGYEVHPAFIKGGEEKDYRYYPAYEGSIVNGRLMSVSGVYSQTSRTRKQFRDLARANGEGWHQIDWHLYELITLYMYIEYGTMNIQSALGQGRTALTGGSWTGGSLIGITGLSNKLGNGTGNYTYAGSADDLDADLSYMSYRGCENFFGNVWKMVDGINVQDYKVYLNSNPETYADDIFTGEYKDIGVTMSSSNGYTRQIAGSKYGIFPTSVSGGGSSTGTTDYYYTASGNRIALVGSNSPAGLYAGPSFLAVRDDSALSYVAVSAGVSR